MQLLSFSTASPVLTDRAPSIQPVYDGYKDSLLPHQKDQGEKEV